MSLEHPTEGEVVGAAVRLYNIVTNYAVDHPETIPQEVISYWDPELWDIAERLGKIVDIDLCAFCGRDV
jgi:hypothetical protein